MQLDNKLVSPIAIILILQFKEFPNSLFGVRQLQRKLNIKSSGTVSKYLTILLKEGLIQKTEDKLYRITQKGIEFNSFSYPVLYQIQYYKGFILSRFTFLLFYIVTSLIFTFVFLLLHLHPLIIFLNMLMSILIMLVVVIKEWLFSRRKYQEFLSPLYDG